MYDITGEQAFYKKSNISSNCSSVGNAFSQKNCQPFVVSVKVNNAYGYLYRNLTIMTSQVEEHVCACLEKNGQLQL